MSAAGKVTNDPSNYFAIALQSAKDTDGTTFAFPKHLDGSGFDVATEAGSVRTGGGGREIALRYRKKVTADGQLVAYAQPDLTGRLLALALGTDTVTAGPSQGSGNAYYSTHLLTSGNSQLPYFTAEQAWADSVERTTNCMISSLKFDGQAGEPIQVTAQFISGGTPHDLVTAQSPVREAAFPIEYPGASVALTVGPYPGGPAVGGSSVQLTKFSFEIKNSLDGNIQTTGLNREDVLWENADYDLDGTLKYINDAVWRQIQYGGGSQVPTGLLTSGTFNFFQQNPSSMSLALYLPFVEFTGAKVNRLDPDGKTMYLDFTASTRNIGTQSVQATVVSGASTAYTSAST